MTALILGLILFLGVHGMTEDAGFTSPDLLETEIDRTFIACADTVVVVADHTKWGVRGLSRVAGLAVEHLEPFDRRRVVPGGKSTHGRHLFGSCRPVIGPAGQWAWRAYRRRRPTEPTMKPRYCESGMDPSGWSGLRDDCTVD